MPDPTLEYSIDYLILYPFCKYISRNFCKDISPNVITIINIILSILILLYLHFINFELSINMMYIIVGLFVLRAFLDALDGTVARMYNKETDLGGNLDKYGDIMFYIGLIIIISKISKVYSIILTLIFLLYSSNINKLFTTVLHDNTLIVIPMMSIILNIIILNNNNLSDERGKVK